DGKKIQISALESEEQRKLLEKLGEEIEKRLKQKAGVEASTTATKESTAATNANTIATEGNTSNVIKWADETKKGKQSADEAAATLRGLTKDQSDAAASTDKTKTAAEGVATSYNKAAEGAKKAGDETKN